MNGTGGQCCSRFAQSSVAFRFHDDDASIETCSKLSSVFNSQSSLLTSTSKLYMCRRGQLQAR